mmetsp:Transcript_68758/g.151451  ORF Transcript_68758/g.151451 Transcript_68758/m.151451 type:complete len:85 (-) Transcript_68758:198-452(-)
MRRLEIESHGHKQGRRCMAICISMKTSSPALEIQGDSPSTGNILDDRKSEATHRHPNASYSKSCSKKREKSSFFRRSLADPPML